MSFLSVILPILTIFFYRKGPPLNITSQTFPKLFFRRLSDRLSRVIKERIVGTLNKHKPIVLSGMKIRMTRSAAAGDNPTKVQQDSVVFSREPQLAT